MVRPEAQEDIGILYRKELFQVKIPILYTDNVGISSEPGIIKRSMPFEKGRTLNNMTYLIEQETYWRAAVQLEVEKLDENLMKYSKQ